MHEVLNWIFFGPARLIVLWPYAGAAIAAVLILAQAILTQYTKRPIGIAFFREAPVFVGLLWLVFNAYELQVSAVSPTAGTGLLRLDLIVLVPILYVLTAAAGISLLRQIRCRVEPEKGREDQ